MANKTPEGEGLPPACLVDPASLHILLVDANSDSRQEIANLLRGCSYQVTSCRTSQEAIQILKAQQGPQGTAGFDLILKEHDPTSGTNACRFLRRCQTESVLRGIPVIVASNTEDRAVMVNCLQLGAADYMLKPLRYNELRNLWARVYWWRRASYLQQQGSGGATLHESGQPVQPQGSAGSEETKCGSNEGEHQKGLIEEERSGKGSVPESSQQKRSGDNASKKGAGISGSQGKAGNGSSRDGNGNSTSKAGQGSNHPGSEGMQPLHFGQGSCPGGTPVQESHVGQPTGLTAAASNAAASLLQIASLNVVGTKAEAPASAHCEDQAEQDAGKLPSNGASQPRQLVSPPAFRAYVPQELPQKRPAEVLQKEEAGRNSDSDIIGSIEKHPPAKKRATTRLGAPATPATSEAGPSDTTFVPPSLNSGQTSKPTANNIARPNLPAGSELQAAGSGAWCRNLNNSSNNTFNSYYPYGMLPPPFAIPPQFWAQFQAGGEADSRSSVPYTHQAQPGHGSKVEAQANLQLTQQQVAMHSQLMFQHSMMMQQYGMAVGSFTPFAGFPGSQLPQAAISSQAPFQAGMQAKGALPHMGLKPTAERSGSLPDTLQRNGSTSCKPAAVSGAFTGRTAGAGTGNGTTLGNGSGAGASSHATAQVGLDGCMVEPSQSERRAQALYKYKQKRKNLCFTKKIRYESRKQLAEARPRVKGQFVRVRSDEIRDMAAALESQKGELDSNNAAIPQIALEKADGDIDIAKQLLKAAKQLVGGNDVDNTEEEETDEEEFEEEDVNSALQLGTTVTVAAPSGLQSKMVAPNGALEVAAIHTSHHNSNSGSNSPENHIVERHL